MPQKDHLTILANLRHDLRGRINSARLNLDAAATLAKKLKATESAALRKHLEFIKDNLKAIEQLIAKATREMK